MERSEEASTLLGRKFQATTQNFLLGKAAAILLRHTSSSLLFFFLAHISLSWLLRELIKVFKILFGLGKLAEGVPVTQSPDCISSLLGASVVEMQRMVILSHSSAS